jgi:hypothetical protein
MKKALIIFITGLLIISVIGVNALNIDKKQIISKYEPYETSKTKENGYTHTVLVGVATSQNCYPCDYMNTFMYSLYNNATHDFHYVDMIVYDEDGNVLNSWADYWAKRYNILKQPTLVFDGGYKIHIGYQSLNNIPAYIDECGNRDIWDITADMTVLWLGEATIQIDINIQNDENEDYSFYLRTFVLEKNSRYKTYFNHFYHHGFLDFAIFGNTKTIPPGGTYSISEIWNGNEHEDGHGNDFGDILRGNIKVITGIYRGNTPIHYIDQTIAATPIDGDMPQKPKKPSGPNIGSEGINYTYSTSTIDPQGEKVYYWFNWGDGSNSGWIGPFDSGATIEASHTWTTSNSFDIKVKAKDIQGHESVWSDSLKVKIPRNRYFYNSIFLQLLEKCLLLQKTFIFLLK